MSEGEETGRVKIKEVEWKLLSELMKNSRRSDRELAKVIGVSQPTVSRLIKKLEKEGFIKEYTMIPCFHKIGYHLLALTFVRLGRNVSPEQLEKAKKMAVDKLRESSFGFILFKTGMGLGYDGVLASFHEDYASFDKLRSEMKKSTEPGIIEMEVFLTSMDDEARYVPLTFSLLARHLLTLKDKQKQ
jgi:DNA-binding Lrp family transcriptional regulator